MKVSLLLPVRKNLSTEGGEQLYSYVLTVIILEPLVIQIETSLLIFYAITTVFL